MNTAPPDEGDSAALHVAKSAAAERERIVQNCESHAWRDITLEPWSRERQSLFARLLACDVPGGDLEDLPRLQKRYEEIQAKEPSSLKFEELVDFNCYLPAAIKVLFIAAVPRETWFHLRGQPLRLLERMEDWAAENIATDEEREACLLAAQIITEHRALIPMHRPRGGGKTDAGN